MKGFLPIRLREPCPEHHVYDAHDRVRPFYGGTMTELCEGGRKFRVDLDAGVAFAAGWGLGRGAVEDLIKAILREAEQ